MMCARSARLRVADLQWRMAGSRPGGLQGSTEGVRPGNSTGIRCAIVVAPGWSPLFFRGASMFGFYSNQLGCLGSLIVSLIGTAILILVIRSCSG